MWERNAISCYQWTTRRDSRGNGAIVNSLVSDVITPALLNPALKAAQVEDLAGLKTDGGILYGKFLAAVISFLVIAFVIFLLVKAINSMKKKEEPAPAAPVGPTQEQLLAEIRDLLKK